MTDFTKLAAFNLKHGEHDSPEHGLCAMEAVAWLEGEEHSDQPQCACPVIGALVIAINDGSGPRERQKLIAYLPRIVGTRSTPEVERLRLDVYGNPYGEAFALSNRDKSIDCASAITRWRRHRDGSLVGNGVLTYASMRRMYRILDAMLAIGPSGNPHGGFKRDVTEAVDAYKALVPA